MRGTRIARAARTAGALLVALVLTFAVTDRDAAAHSAPDTILLPSAGWHGRPIEAPHRHETLPASAPARPIGGWSAGPVGYGDGFHRPGGSDRVREVQRRLARLGYRVGPIDGLFGRLTRASVAWFQVKHGLPVTGRATLATVRHLRARTGRPTAVREVADDRSEPVAAPEPAWQAFRELVGPRVPVPDGRGVRTRWPVAMWLLIALVAVDLLLLIGLHRQRRSGTITTIALGPPEPAPPAGWEERAGRRFAPPGPLPPRRPPDGVAAGTREAGDE
jgi:peptidoglycan hydrolase-like protein with peptidoglycan-binding domain